MKHFVGMMVVAGMSSVAFADVVNGDFETGSLGPSTSAYGTNDIYAPAQYLIVSYDTVHTSWVDFYDHTYGTSDGHYMIVNGTTTGTGPTWAQTVSVTPNTQYTLSAWFASLIGNDIANVEFRVNGFVVTPAFSAPNATGVWEQRSVTFNSGASTSISVEIWDSSQLYSGNDYAIDDIHLTPTPGAAALMVVGGLASARRRRV